MTTVKAPFGGRVPLVNLDKPTSIPGGFVFQLPDEFTPSHISDGFSQVVVLDHVFDLQTLDTDRLVLTDQLCGELVLRITPSITDPSVNTGDLEPCLGSVLGALLFLGETTLSPCQLLFIRVSELGIAVGVSLGGDDHGLQAQVKSHLLGNNVQELDVLLDQDGHEIASGGIFGDRDGGGLAPFGQGARPVDVQRGVHLCQGELLSIPLEGGSGVFGGLFALPFLEGGILGTSLKEVLEGFLQVAQSLLRRHTGNLIEPGVIILLLQEGELRGQGIVANALLLLVVGIGTQPQGPIVDITSTTKCPSKYLCLLRRRIKSILVCSFLLHASQSIMYLVKSQQARGFPRHLEISEASSETSSGATSQTQFWTCSIRYSYAI